MALATTRIGRSKSSFIYIVNSLPLPWVRQGRDYSWTSTASTATAMGYHTAKTE